MKVPVSLASFAVFVALTALVAPAPLRAAPPGVDEGEPAVPVPEGPDPEAAGAHGPGDYEDPVARALAVTPGGLTADEVARRASESAPTLSRARADVELAHARRDEARTRYVPQLGLSASYTRVSRAPVQFGSGQGFLVGALNEGPLGTAPCPTDPGAQCVVDAAGLPVAAVDTALVNDPPLNFFDFTASLAVPISDYFTAVLPAAKASELGLEGARLAVEAERLTVEVDARVAYYEWLRARARVAVAEASLVRSQARLADAQAAFRVGVNSNADVQRLDALVARTEAARIASEAAERVARRNLAVIMDEGDARSIDYAVGEDVLVAHVGPEPGPLPELIVEAQSERLELRAVGANREAASKSLQASRAAYYPSLVAYGEATMANPNQRFFPLREEWNGNWAVGLRLQWFLDAALVARTQVSQQRARVHQVEAESEQLRRVVAMQVTQAYEDRARALASAATYRREVEAAVEGYRVATMLFRVGEATTTDIIEAELDQSSASLSEVDNQIAIHVADLRLRYAVGRLAPVGAPGAR